MGYIRICRHGRKGAGRKCSCIDMLNSIHSPATDTKFLCLNRFQESLFSRRLLIFDWTKVAWLCGRCVWSEAKEDSFPRQEIWPVQRPHSLSPMGLLSQISELPNLSRWGNLIQEFTSRSLTYEQDFEAAFAGATEVIASTFPGGLLHGLPVFFFDIALLWRQGFEKARRTEKPSWSWTGWKTIVQCWMPWSPYDPGDIGASMGPPHWFATKFLEPVAKWDTGLNLEHFNGCYDYLALREDPDAALPDGWQRVEHPEGAFYTHVSNMDDHRAYFYPLPPAMPGAQSALTILPTILTCTAPIAPLFIGTTVDRIDDSFHPVTPLFFYRGKSIGSLSGHRANRPDSKQWWQLHSRACELVAISETKLARGRCKWMGNGDFTDDPANESADFVSIYNVLWIEWEGDIAYREDVGVVSKDAWDALEPEVRTFKFG